MNVKRASDRRPLITLLSIFLVAVTLWLAGRETAHAELVTPLIAAQPLNVPQAVGGTFAVGVSNGNIVGGFYAASGVSGFISNGSSFTPLNFPGSAMTTSSGISGNDIVGSYTDSASQTHGFHYDGTNWTSLDNPAGNYTVATGISANNTVGYYIGGDSQMHGFLYNSANSPQFTPLDDPTPGTQLTVAYGISGSDIVGYFMDDHFHGFSYRGGVYTTLDFPDSLSTTAYGISGNNIVGDYQDSDGIYHGFLYDGTNWSTLNVPFPGSTSTKTYGISGNTVVGEYVDSSLVHHGFVAQLNNVVPEPSARSSLALLAMSGFVYGVAIRRRRRSGLRQRFA
jgi:hypothetical protein